MPHDVDAGLEAAFCTAPIASISMSIDGPAAVPSIGISLRCHYQEDSSDDSEGHGEECSCQ
jgi:hypothetical protein